jgi:hypothetical protein
VTDLGNSMRWQVIVELTGADGGRPRARGRCRRQRDRIFVRPVGLMKAEGKQMLAGLRRLIQAQVEDHCWERRRCSHGGSQRTIDNTRRRRLLSLFGTVEVRAPRFAPCRCAVTCRRTLSPITEIMSDRCTPEYECVVAKMVCCPTAVPGLCCRSSCRSLPPGG